MRILFLLFVFLGFAFSQDVSVKASVSASQVFIGDVFDYKVEVVAKEGAGVTLPSFVGNLGSFEIRDLKTSEEKLKDGLVKTIHSAVLNTFVSGDFALAPQEVQVVFEADTVVTLTDPVAIRVLPRTTEADVDILEAEGPVSVPGTPWYVFVLIALGVLLLALLFVFLWKYLKRNVTEKVLPPYEEAMLALSILREKKIADSDQGQYFMELGFIVRRYVEKRFKVDILDATVAELKQRMSCVAGLPEAFKMGVVSLAVETEPVKFAKVNLEKDRVLHWENFTFELLEKTKPVPEEEKKSGEKR